MPQTIELDCEPIGPRPSAFIAGVMKDSGVEYDNREPISKFFGNWTWDFSEIPAELWKKAQPTFKERITALYYSGAIRYGSW